MNPGESTSVDSPQKLSAEVIQTKDSISPWNSARKELGHEHRFPSIIEAADKVGDPAGSGILARKSQFNLGSAFHLEKKMGLQKLTKETKNE